jgi:hypothetical protein
LLPLVGGEVGEHQDDVTAAIGRARAELREIAGLLASSDPAPQRRRSRLTAIATASDSLFPL